jgi:hypothetical protein
MTKMLDLTDLDAFPKPGDVSKSILIMNVRPSAGMNPPAPTTDEPFATEAVYELKMDTDGDSVAGWDACIAWVTRSPESHQTVDAGRLPQAGGMPKIGSGTTWGESRARPAIDGAPSFWTSRMGCVRSQA